MVALVLAALLWRQVEPAYLVVWLAVLIALNLQGGWLLWLERSRTWQTREWVKAGRLFDYRNAVIAVVWGAGLATFFCLAAPSGQLAVLAAMVLVTGGFSVGSPAFGTVLRFAALVLLPTALAAPLRLDGPLYPIASGILVLFFLVCLRFAWTSDRTLSLSVLLRMRNERLARELARTNARLEEANAAKTRFLAAANHDLRQPMHAIGLLVSALRAHAHAPEAQAIVAKIQASVEAMNSLFSAILDISKLDANAVAPTTARADAERRIGGVRRIVEERPRRPHEADPSLELVIGQRVRLDHGGHMGDAPPVGRGVDLAVSVLASEVLADIDEGIKGSRHLRAAQPRDLGNPVLNVVTSFGKLGEHLGHRRSRVRDRELDRLDRGGLVDQERQALEAVRAGDGGRLAEERVPVHLLRGGAGDDAEGADQGRQAVQGRHPALQGPG